jgi:hypothetical protein
MPQMRKGGKYVFGWSWVREDGSVIIPDEAFQEYRLGAVDKVFLISGSKTSGGFVRDNKSLLGQSPLSGIILSNPGLASYGIAEGKIIRVDNRSICWVNISPNRRIVLSEETLDAFGTKPGDRLLSVRGSNFGNCMLLKGPLLEVAKTYPEIKVFK